MFTVDPGVAPVSGRMVKAETKGRASKSALDNQTTKLRTTTTGNKMDKNYLSLASMVDRGRRGREERGRE